MIDRDWLGFGGDAAPDQAPSRKQMRKRLDALRSASQSCVNDVLLPALAECMEDALPDTVSWKIEAVWGRIGWYLATTLKTPKLLELNEAFGGTSVTVFAPSAPGGWRAHGSSVGTTWPVFSANSTPWGRFSRRHEAWRTQIQCPMVHSSKGGRRTCYRGNKQPLLPH